ncbi:MAG: Gfo/Idh/MocA family oxidoreductase [Pseudobutyrivibrio sp.]|nr:Gfo/Idh/MocA family oxidoreductase [Pseudobutyrivibrio sp.]
MLIKVGIVGCGRIAARFVSEIKYVSGVEIGAVYNPHIDSAKEFANTHGIDFATDSWEEFLMRCDSVYVASTHKWHYSYAKNAIQAGKHVLCEKPMCFKESQVRELFELARENQVVLMEAIKTRFCPGYKKVLELVRSGAIGDVVGLEANFTRLTDSMSREFNDIDYGGSFTEFATYNLLAVADILGYDYSRINFSSVILPNGVDSYTRAALEYCNEEEFLINGSASFSPIAKEAVIKTGLGAKTEGQLVVTGDQGYILVPSPWWLTSYIEVRHEDSNAIEKYQMEYQESGLRYEIEYFRDLILGKETDMGIKNSEFMAKIMEGFLHFRKPFKASDEEKKSLKIWAHRGLSLQYPENTLLAFEEAAKLKGLTGIELDVQYSKDKEIMVFHDETLDRVMEATGNLRDYTCQELQAMKMKNAEQFEDGGFIPTMRQVLECLSPYLKQGLKINIELKTSKVRYEGIEKDTYDLVKSMGFLDNIVWSSFLDESIKIIKDIDAKAETGMLSGVLSDCVSLGDLMNCDAYHPSLAGLYELKRNDVKKLRASGKAVRAWNTQESLYHLKRKRYTYDMREYAAFGVTDLIVNEADKYLN